MSVAITCATCGLFFDDFGAFEAHQIDTCRPKDAIEEASIPTAEQMAWMVDRLKAVAAMAPKCPLPIDAFAPLSKEDEAWWRSTVTVRDALFLRQIRIDPL